MTPAPWTLRSHACFFVLFLLLNRFFLPTGAIIITLPLQFNTSVYDYVIVGGGTAGLVIANRLTENSSITVLVLEAGINDQKNVPLQVPFLGPILAPNTEFDWNTTTVVQPGLNNRTVPFNRGRVLGGSSSINFMFHQYGTMDDWNRLASVVGDPGWNWTNIRQYIAKHDKIVQPADAHDTTGQIVTADHGTAGEVPISLPGSNLSIDSRVLSTTQQLSAEFPFNEDTAGGNHTMLGLGFIQSSIGDGTRSSSSSTYLAGANDRPNLVVLVNATAVVLLQTGMNASSGEPVYGKLQFVQSPPPGNLTLGTKHTVTAMKSIILSAGTVGTSQLLQLSGIGDSTALTRLQIDTTIHNPSVGANLSDHILIPNIFQVTTNDTLDSLLRNTSGAAAAAMAQWKLNKTGDFANTVANNYGFVKIPDNSTIFKMAIDTAAGPNSPHWEIIFSNLFFQPGVEVPPTGNFLTVVTIIVAPKSRGTVALQSANPLIPPLVDPQYISAEFDKLAAIESVHGVQRFLAAPAWAGYISAPFGQTFAAALTGNDTLIEAYVRSVALSAFHGVGTAAMAPVGATWGVVNPDLTLKGAGGSVRIVDASVFPFTPSCHTQGPVYLLAERAADLIKAAQ
ncbi:Pyranose dehydrogenase 1 [Psilocybe cubensis]|uniref:pyranose dehydrogenase (acceptor) n=2 Tax=Psilocybe cubensis TaxID=181762 RepID=A0A8H7XN87_PSICU|nr:Pyranose dehydrogenase 1 [Psilocybe cubensis]KAH9476225.1 Pyranose dehydrogenase 1 [Psilocybe cubensis]